MVLSMTDKEISTTMGKYQWGTCSDLSAVSIDADQINNQCSGNVFDDSQTKNMMFESNGSVFIFDQDGMHYIMPAITEVKTINDRVVIITFADGTKEKTVLAEDDTFSLEQGISICITKRILSRLVKGCGSSVYNKLINYSLKNYSECQKFKQERQKIIEQIKEQEKRDEEKRQKKIAKMKKQKTQEMTDIMAEAIRKALLDNCNIGTEETNNKEENI